MGANRAAAIVVGTIVIVAAITLCLISRLDSIPSWLPFLVLPAASCGLWAATTIARRREPLQAAIQLERVTLHAWRRARRVVILVIGLTILALSIPIGLLPGPGGIAVALGGLALLATEFLWARRLLNRVRSTASAIATKAGQAIDKRPRPYLIPLIAIALAALIFAAATMQTAVPLKTVLLFSIGPVLAWAFWSFTTMRAWIKHRAKRKSPAADAAGDHTLKSDRQS
jgi:hypothetical protein